MVSTTFKFSIIITPVCGPEYIFNQALKCLWYVVCSSVVDQNKQGSQFMWASAYPWIIRSGLNPVFVMWDLELLEILCLSFPWVQYLFFHKYISDFMAISPCEHWKEAPFNCFVYYELIFPKDVGKYVLITVSSYLLWIICNAGCC